MKVNDIDYYEFQKLIASHEALNRLLNDDQKYFRIDQYSGLYISLSESEIIKEFKNLNDELKKCESSIREWSYRSNKCYSDFFSTYKPK